MWGVCEGWGGPEVTNSAAAHEEGTGAEGAGGGQERQAGAAPERSPAEAPKAPAAQAAGGFNSMSERGLTCRVLLKEHVVKEADGSILAGQGQHEETSN